MSGVGKLFLLRHADTPANAPGEERVRGFLPYPITDAGRRDTAGVAATLRVFGVKHIFTDDLVRTRQTADLIATALDLPLNIDNGCLPWDLGSLAGALVEEVLPDIRRLIDSRDALPPGSSQSYREFLNIWNATLWHYLASARISQEAWLLVTHSGNFYALEHILSGWQEPIRTSGDPGPNIMVALSQPDGTHLELQWIDARQPGPAYKLIGGPTKWGTA